VRAAVLLLEKRTNDDPNLNENYPIRYLDIDSLGYDGSGNAIRGFTFRRLTAEIATWLATARPRKREGYHWSGFVVQARDLAADGTWRLDYKYWKPEVRQHRRRAVRDGGRTIESLNLVQTVRGKSPAADLYVDPTDGFARVLKSGSSLTAFREIAPVTPESDFIEKAEYDRLPDSCKVRRGDILLASTGTGTLGKAAVYESNDPAIADGHVTIIRVNGSEIYPRYLADFLRAGFGRAQIECLYTGRRGSLSSPLSRSIRSW
jgi:type I restriction enzyme M protein